MKSFIAAVGFASSLLFSTAFAQVTGVNAIDCQGFRFTQSEAQAASNAALSHLVAGTTVGDNDYPHQEFNFEGFTFDRGCEEPFWEFPIFQDHVFTGGDPGVDRVIIGTVRGDTAVFCDGVTHFNAPGDDFLQCDS